MGTKRGPPLPYGPPFGHPIWTSIWTLRMEPYLDPNMDPYLDPIWTPFLLETIEINSKARVLLSLHVSEVYKQYRTLEDHILGFHMTS